MNSTHVEEKTGVDLLGQLGYQEVPEKVWVWAFDDGTSVSDATVYGYRDVATSAKGITAFVRPYFNRRVKGLYVSDGYPEETTLQKTTSPQEIRGVVLYDDNGQEIRRWEVGK